MTTNQPWRALRDSISSLASSAPGAPPVWPVTRVTDRALCALLFSRPSVITLPVQTDTKKAMPSTTPAPVIAARPQAQVTLRILMRAASFHGRLICR